VLETDNEILGMLRDDPVIHGLALITDGNAAQAEACSGTMIATGALVGVWRDEGPDLGATASGCWNQVASDPGEGFLSTSRRIGGLEVGFSWQAD
jgi:hypothetical protein